MSLYLPAALAPMHIQPRAHRHSSNIPGPAHAAVCVAGDIEDGVPSAHCCGAVSLLYYGIHAAAAAGLLSEQHKLLAQAAAAVWVVWLAWGRAYLGLHSPLDLATGTLLGWALLRLWLSIEQPYVACLQASVQAGPWQLPLQVLLASAVLMRCYPMPSRWTSCYNYATAWAAGWAGVTVGWGILQQAQLQAPGSSSAGGLFGGVVPPLACKVFLGLGLVAASKVLVKAVLLAAFKQAFKLVPLTVRRWWQPPVVGAVRQPPLQQQQSQRLAGYVASVAGSAGAAEKRGDQKAAGGAGAAVAVLTAHVSDQPSPKAGRASSAAGGSEVLGLRHTAEGVGNDVVAAARWCSYFAVGLTVSLWQAGWPLVLQQLAPSVSVS